MILKEAVKSVGLGLRREIPTEPRGPGVMVWVKSPQRNSVEWKRWNRTLRKPSLKAWAEGVFAEKKGPERRLQGHISRRGWPRASVAFELSGQRRIKNCL